MKNIKDQIDATTGRNKISPEQISIVVKYIDIHVHIEKHNILKVTLYT